jgi:hypothetical protein
MFINLAAPLACLSQYAAADYRKVLGGGELHGAASGVPRRPGRIL